MMNLNEFDLVSFKSCIGNKRGLFPEWVHLLEYIMICNLLFTSLSERLNEFIFLFLTIFQGIPVLTAATLASLTQQVQQQQQQQQHQQQVQQQQQPAAAAVLQQLQQLQNASTQPLQVRHTLNL